MQDNQQEQAQEHQELLQNRRKKHIIILLMLVFFYVMVSSDDAFTDVKPSEKAQQEEKFQNERSISHQQLFNQSMNQTQMNILCFEILQDLWKYNFRGKWQEVSDVEESVSKQSQGDLRFEFTQQHYGTSSFNLEVLLTWGIYSDDYQTGLLYELVPSNLVYDNATRTANFVDIRVGVVGGRIHKTLTECKMNLSLELSGVQNISQSFVKQLNIKMLSHNISSCQMGNFQGSATLDLTDYESKALLYSILMSLVSVVQVLASLKILRDVVLDERQASCYSLITLVMVTAQDGYLSILHFFFSLNDDILFQYFITPSFMYFILFSVLEMRLIILVWKERHNNLQDNLTLRRELIRFYIKFYVAMIFMVVLLYNYIYTTWLAVVLSLYIVPQIIHSALRGQPIKFDKVYLFGLLASRSIVPLYYRGYSDNFLELRTNPTLCLTIIFVVALQIVVVFYQSYYGPRFFVPLRWQPKKFNYFQDLEGDYECPEECAVCILPLSQSPSMLLTAEEESNVVLKRIIERENNGKQIMITPCEHKFHIICLAKWMSIRMNCPSCRQDLPSLM